GPAAPSTGTVSRSSCATAPPPPTTRWTACGRRVSGAACPGSGRGGLRGVDGLPQVVLGAILEALPRSGCFWRCVAALNLARRLSVAPSQPLRIVQLGRVVAWERGTVPQLAADDSVETLPPFVRLTIDNDGLSKVERLAERPLFSRQRFDDRAFVVEREDWFGVTLAQFKDPQDPGFAVWDTPTPPDLAQCPVPLERLDSGRRFHTIDLAAVTGITFFFLHTKMSAIHAHSPSQPCAMPTYKALQEIRELDKYCTWVYVPLPRGDTRALGQCRLHVAAERTYARPRSVAFAKSGAEGGSNGVKVCFDGPGSCLRDGEKWSHYAMAGTLEFWFTGWSADISMRGGTLMPDEEGGEKMLGQLADSV
ncbi:hypothetical protein C8A01DRAFT_19869, partial [Parachaetomium inaequale]